MSAIDITDLQLQEHMANLVDGIVQSRTVKRLRENKTLLKWSGLMGGVLGVFLLSTLPEYSKRSVSPLSPELQEIDKSIKEAHAKTDPFVRERFVQQEAKRLGLTSDDYRKLFAIRKKNSEVLPDAPTSLPSQVVWFYQDLSRGQRLQLVEQGGRWLLGVLPNLTILFVGVRFLVEIPQREEQAKLQAWRIVHEAYGQRFSRARVRALETLRAQGERLSKLTLEEGADLSHINLTSTNLERSSFIGADLSYAILNDADLHSANLSRSHLEGAYLVAAILYAAVLDYANLEGAKLSGANLEHANLEGAKLSGANLEHAKLVKANFKNATYSKDTIFPQGFDPIQHGMSLSEELSQQTLKLLPPAEIPPEQNT